VRYHISAWRGTGHSKILPKAWTSTVFLIIIQNILVMNKAVIILALIAGALILVIFS
jgi:hypothetical protein